MSPGSATLHDLLLALQWQNEDLKGRNQTSDLYTQRNVCSQSVNRESDFVPHLGGMSRRDDANYLLLHPSGAKPPSPSSFDSGFDGAGSGPLEMAGGKTCPYEASRPNPRHLHAVDEKVSNVSENLTEEKSHAQSIHIVPSARDGVNFEITVKRSTILPTNPWLSLPVDGLENCYTVIISPGQQRVTRNCNQLTQTGDASMCEVQDQSATEWSPIHNILSSTATDEEHAAETSESVPTLLWDSYDLHDLPRDSDSMLDEEPECEWEFKEQQELRTVEEMLNRAAGIIQEEENVLAQEEIFNILLETDDPGRLWPSWNKDLQCLTTMSSSDLAEAGVIGLEDDLASINFGNNILSRESLKVIQNVSDVSSEPCTDQGNQPGNEGPDRLKLLKEMANIEVLEKKIAVENFRIRELCRCESDERTYSLSLSEDRKRFLQKLEQEKKEVEEMEKDLSIEMKKSEQTCSSKSRKIVTCCVMEKASVLKDDEALLKNCRRTAQVHSQPRVEDPTNWQPSDLTADHVQHKCSESETSNNSECSTVGADSSSDDCFNMALNSEGQQNIHSSISAALPSLIEDDAYKCDVERKDLVLSVTDLHYAQGLINPIDPDDMSEDKLVHADTLETLDTSKQSKENPKGTTLTSEEVWSTAFDPGGPTRLPQTSTLIKQKSTEENASSAVNKTASSTALTSTVDPNPDELKNPPCRTSQELENQNTNNNNLNTVGLGEGVGSEKVSEELGRSIRPESQKPDTCDGPIFMLESCVPVEAHHHDGSLRRSICRSPLQQQLQICTRDMSEFQTPVVLDTGSSLVKAGFADQDLPTIVFPNAIGLPKYEVNRVLGASITCYLGYALIFSTKVIFVYHMCRR